MKKYNKILLLVLIIGTSFISCEEYLDVSPELGISAEEVYTDYFTTRGAVDRANRLIHNYVYSDTDWASEIGAMSDESQFNNNTKPPHTVLNSGNWLNEGYRELGGMQFENSNAEFHNNDHLTEPASKAFLAIRAVNQVLENIDKLTEYPTELGGYSPEELKNQLIGQSYFLRGFHYFQVIRRYGGFPIMDKIFGNSYDFDEVRPSYLESTDALVADLDLAIQFLPEQWNDQNLGRATKSSARALKAMVLLYASSPLMNPDLNPFGSNSRTYNTTYAENAAKAAGEAINGLSAGGYEMYNWDNYTENWYSRETGFPKEALIQPPLSRHTDPNTSGRAGQGWFLPQFEGGWRFANQPTHNAAEWFETVDGYDVNDPDAVSSGSFDPSNPYANRDPRLKSNMFTQGDDMYEGFNKPGGAIRKLDATPNGWHFKFEKGKGNMWGGYYSRKHKWPGNNKWHRARNYYRTFPHIRVAQVYLDFAEAANEAYGPNGAVPGTSLTAVQAINVVRNRANMPNILSKYITDKETFKKRIYNERGVELYNEFHRWHDLRRWKLSKEVFSQGIYMVDIQEVGGNLVYGKKIISGAQRIFEDRHYWYPFTTDVMNLMSKFEQNPGW